MKVSKLSDKISRLLANQLTMLFEATANSISHSFAFGKIFSLSSITSQLLGIAIDKVSVSFFINPVVEVVASSSQHETTKNNVNININIFLNMI
ncbi:hypothetical protein HOG27_05350 [bacterium]|nr:hypothetical protein [bacterium]MBT6778591.1 hypothetical protein [bacterium]